MGAEGYLLSHGISELYAATTVETGMQKLN